MNREKLFLIRTSMCADHFKSDVKLVPKSLIGTVENSISLESKTRLQNFIAMKCKPLQFSFRVIEFHFICFRPVINPYEIILEFNEISI